MVDAIEPAVRRYEHPPAKGMAVETHWSQVWISAADWAAAFDAAGPAPRTTKRAKTIWDELVEIDRQEARGAEVAEDLLRRSLARNRALVRHFDKAWPLIEADRHGRGTSGPPRSSCDGAPRHRRTPRSNGSSGEDPFAWTVSDLPLIDAARQRLGDPDASRRARRREAEIASERQVIDKVVEDILEAGDGNVEEMILLKGADLQDALVHYEDLRPATRTCSPDRSRTSWWTRRRS